jgi:hypothetical protein
MTDTATASVLMTQVRQHTDTESDANITDAFLLSLIDKSYNKLYRQIATEYAGYFDVEDSSKSLIVGQRAYALAADFMHLRGVDIVIGGERVKLSRIGFGERNRRTNDPRYVPRRIERLRTNYAYYTQKDNLIIDPVPTTTEQIIMTYVPRPTRITNSSNTFDVIAGFEDFVVYDASVSVLGKQERDVTVMAAQRQDALSLIIQTVSPRETGDPIQVRDDYFGAGGFYW